MRSAAVLLACALLAAGCGSDREREAAEPAVKPVLCGDFDTAALMGKTVGEARAAAEREDCTVRVVRADGKPFAGTKDYRRNRIGVEVEDGAITKVTGIG